MNNPLQIQHKSRLIENKSRDIYQQLTKDYEEGRIRSKVAYLQRMYHDLESFYQSLVKPTFKMRKAWGDPSSTDYNQMLQEIRVDLEVLFSESDLIGDSLQQMSQQANIDQQNLESRIAYLEDQLQVTVTAPSKNNYDLVIVETFADHRHYDVSMVKETPAHISSKNHALMIHPETATVFSDGVKVRIVEGTGLPGNTKEVRHVNGKVRFVGEDSLHIHLADLLDNNINTWFEYELIHVDEEVLTKGANLGFSYQEGIKWIADPGETLRLMFEIELPFIERINWFSLQPFIPNNRVSSPAMVQSIKVSDGKGNTKEILQESEVFNHEQVYLFEEQDCKTITVLIEQDSFYETSIGHLFFKELEDQNINFFDRDDNKDRKRIDGSYPSVENLNVQYDAEKQKLTYPSVMQGAVISSVETRKKNLFLPPAVNEGVYTGIEAFPAKRYVIGLREVNIANYTFKEASEYVSKSFHSPYPIQSVSLEAKETIPSSLGEGEWIVYSISIDHGKNWHTIAPRGSFRPDGKYMYLLNTNMPADGRISHFEYLDPGVPIHEIKVRIQLYRPTTIPHHKNYTPLVNEYQLHITTERGGENVN